MPARDWLLRFALGGLCGALGQSLRVVVGLKKVHDQALQAGKPFGELFSPGTLMVSLLVGAIAGILGTTTETIDLQAVTRENILALVGMGYAGADFIEGFVRKRIPAPAAAPPAEGDAAQAPVAVPPVAAPSIGRQPDRLADAPGAGAPPPAIG